MTGSAASKGETEIVVVCAVLQVCQALKTLGDAKGMFPAGSEAEGLGFFERWASDVEAQAACIRQIGGKFRDYCDRVQPGDQS